MTYNLQARFSKQSHQAQEFSPTGSLNGWPEVEIFGLKSALKSAEVTVGGKVAALPLPRSLGIHSEQTISEI